MKIDVRALLARLGLLQPAKLMYIGGSDVLPPPLKPAEEQALLKRLSDGDEAARQTLIERNLRLVVYIARRFENTGIHIEDLISIGTIGLIKGISSYRPEKGTRLATYAAKCIENAILTRANAGRRIGTISTALGVILVLFRVYREGGPIDLILR